MVDWLLEQRHESLSIQADSQNHCVMLCCESNMPTTRRPATAQWSSLRFSTIITRKAIAIGGLVHCVGRHSCRLWLLITILTNWQPSDFS